MTCVLLGACTTLAIFLAATTVYYRRKARQLQLENKVYLVFVFVFLLQAMTSETFTDRSGRLETKGRGLGRRCREEAGDCEGRPPSSSGGEESRSEQSIFSRKIYILASSMTFTAI